MYKKASRFQKWSKLLGHDSREHEDARDAKVDRSTGQKRTSGEEFRFMFQKLRRAVHSLGGKLDETNGEFGWQERLRKSSEIQSRWFYLLHGGSGPLPSYDDYHAARRVHDDLERVTEALFDPEAAVVVAMIELTELRAKYQGCKSDRVQQDVERHARELLITCKKIKEQTEDGKHNLGHLIYEVSAFDTHYDRYNQEEDNW